MKDFLERVLFYSVFGLAILGVILLMSLVAIFVSLVLGINIVYAASISLVAAIFVGEKVKCNLEDR